MKRNLTILGAESSEDLRPSVEAPIPFRFPVEPSACPDSVHTDHCAPFERIGVKTRNSFYEVIVLTGGRGEVLLRGGRFLSDFRRGRLAGSTAGGSALKPRTIEVGLRMELVFGDEIVTTSTVLSLVRTIPPS